MEYIERKAALQAIDCDNLRSGIVSALKENIEAIPAADVREVKRSHWFDGACVNCGFKPALDYEYETVYDKWNGYAWNFCPNCGADMRSKEDADHV